MPAPTNYANNPAQHNPVDSGGLRESRVIHINRAAKVVSIPEGSLLRILVALSRSRILWSIKGPNGGYRLGRPAREISLLDVVEAVEGPLRGVVLFTPGDAASAIDRKLEDVFEKATETVRKQLQKVRISDLVAVRKGK